MTRGKGGDDADEVRRGGGDASDVCRPNLLVVSSLHRVGPSVGCLDVW